MKGTKAAGRYAMSLIELAAEQNKLDAVKQDMELVAATISDNRDLQLLLESPIIKVDKKQAVLEGVFGKKVEEITLRFITTLCAKGRESMMPAMVEAFVSLYKERMGIVTAEVTSAVALTKEARAEINTALAPVGKSIELVEHVDPKVLGGLKITVGDRRIDATLRKKLNELKYDIHNS